MDIQSTISALSGVITIVAILGSILSVVSFVSMCILYEAKNCEWWRSIIPFYNIYIYFRTFWDMSGLKKFIIFFCTAFIGPFIGLIIVALGGKNEIVQTIGAVLMILLMFIGIIGLMVVCIMGVYHVSTSFGHGVGFFLGLLFLNPIFVIILAAENKQAFNTMSSGRRTAMFIVAGIFLLLGIMNALSISLTINLMGQLYQAGIY